MATAAVTYPNFVNGTASDADQIDQNFADVVSFLNDDLVHVDGAKAMTARLSLAALDPTADDHAVRKSYLDGAYVLATGGVSQAYTANVTIAVLFSTEVADTASAYNLATGVFTAPRTGVYLVSWGSSFTSADNDVIRMSVRTAGATTFQGPVWEPDEVNALESPYPTMSLAVKVNSGEAIEARASSANTVSRTLGSWLTITWLHG